MINFKNIKFVRKLQYAFSLLAFIAAIIAISSYLLMSKLETKKDQIFLTYIKPSIKINELFSRIKKTQFVLLKFSIPSFESELENNMQFVSAEKDSIESIFNFLKEQQFEENIKKKISETHNIWTNYKNVVVDAIQGAGVIKDYEMAAVITTSSGEELAAQIENHSRQVENLLKQKANQLNEEISAIAANSKMILILCVLIGVSIFIFSAFKLAPVLTKPIVKINEVMHSFSLGNYNINLESNSNDEFGQVYTMLGKIKIAQKEKIVAAINIANGIVEKVTPASEKDELAFAFNKEVETINDLAEEISLLTKSAIEGNLGHKGNSKKFSGKYKDLVDGVNETVEALVKPINEGKEVLQRLAEGDLNAKVVGSFNGDHAILKESINHVSESLKSILDELANVIAEVSKSSEQISTSSEEMAAGAEEQTSQTNEVACSIEQMTKTIFETSKNTSIAAESAKSSGEKARQGGKVVTNTITGMNKIASVVTSSADTVFALGQSSEKIGEIVQVIDDIADQTNLLALNAAIEAARAGEQGRGFAVVADEVRKLAERTTKATKEIALMIRQIQKDTKEAVDSMKHGIVEVEEGKKSAVKAGEVLKEIVDGADKVSDIVIQVATASEEQSAAAEVIGKNIEAISNVTRETSTGIQQIAHAAEDLNNLTNSLQIIIKKFNNNNQLSSLKVRSNGKIVH
jgi:methyl-accepting chemotaxis protein